MVVELNNKRSFRLKEANQLIPVIFKITKKYKEEVERKLQQLEILATKNHSSIDDLEAEVDLLISTWQGKIERLGGKVTGLWMIDFNSGDGYFCWKFPEPEILFWHRYEDGYTKRIPVEEWFTAVSRISSDSTSVQERN